MDDLISRQAAITAIQNAYSDTEGGEDKYAVWKNVGLTEALHIMQDLPAAQQTLYGYKVEHLAYIAMVMEKEGVTAEYAVRTFDDMSRAIRMIIEEAQQKVEEALNE